MYHLPPAILIYTLRLTLVLLTTVIWFHSMLSGVDRYLCGRTVIM